MVASISAPAVYVATVVFLVAGFLWLRSSAYPKPIPGIPYHAASAQRIMGDLPSLIAHFDKHATRFDWMANQCIVLNSPIVQLFLVPFGKPWVFVDDHWEAESILARRNAEFDRAGFFADLFAGSLPKASISMKTDPHFKAQRRLWSDIMSPSFLDGVIAPLLMESSHQLVRLLKHKSKLADGRPFEVANDVSFAILDALWQALSAEEVGTTKAQADYLATVDRLALGDMDEAIVLPQAPVNPFFDAICNISDSLTALATSPVLRWHALMMPYLPSRRAAYVLKDQSLSKTLDEVCKRVDRDDKGAGARSALDVAVAKQLQLTGSISRADATALKDEAFSLAIGGHETTASVLVHGLKYLSDNQEAQDSLRTALISSLPDGAESTPRQLARTSIPELDANIEEMLRCTNAASGINRVATCDTEVLGHAIPAGTLVWCMNNGASYTSPAFQIEESRRSQGALTVLSKVPAWHTSAADIASYRPSRWLTDGHFNPMAGPSMPFSAGIRGCFGKKMAYLELRLLLVPLILNFRFEKVPDKLRSFAQITRIATQPQTSFVRVKTLDI